MPQLMIDTTTESAEALLRVSAFIRHCALMKDPDVEIPADAPRPAQNDPAKLFAANPAPSVPAGTSTPPPPPVPSTATAPATVSSAAPAADSAPKSDTTGTPAVLDSTGATHDPTKHSVPAKLNKDGTWRVRRGLDKVNPSSGATASAPVSQTVPAAAPIAAGPTTTPTTTSPSSAPPPPPNNVVPLPAVPPAPPPGGTPAVLPGATAESVTDFRTLMKAVSPLLANKQLAPEILEGICQANGVSGVGQLAPQPMLIPKVWADIRAACGIA